MNIRRISHLKYIVLAGSIFCLTLFVCLSFLTHHSSKQAQQSFAFVLDVSQSMNVQDMQGKSRLDAAKEYIRDTLLLFQNAQFSLTVFAGESQRILPFTQERDLFVTFLSAIDSNNIQKQGTRIDLALEDAIKNFNQEEGGRIILLTDGGDTPIEISKTLQSTLKKQNIELFLLAIGTEKGGYIPTGDFFAPYKMYQGSPVISKLNEASLRSFSKNIGAQYLTYPEKIPVDTFSPSSSSFPHIFLLLSFLFWMLFLVGVFREIYKK